MMFLAHFRRLLRPRPASTAEFPPNPIEPEPVTSAYQAVCLTPKGSIPLSARDMEYRQARFAVAENMSSFILFGYNASFSNDPYGVMLERNGDLMALTIIGGTDGAQVSKDMMFFGKKAT